ncbi:hypothetical protein O181_017118 [Austropuccinia psidii MF-1]|uniref:Uncharacterized protein n=1 Tax=Austropuccinia psidii MF-1 TaxID=1389203 RepID=A0A9Q3C6I5_9BASI|nr:hypothetical protein [Austropuccinia psidii MF-1]
MEGTQRLPSEIILQILEDIEHDAVITLDEPSSPYYWCLPGITLSAAWFERREEQKLAWSRSVPPLFKIDKPLRHFMARRLKAIEIPPSWESFEPSMSSFSRPVSYFANTFYNHNSLMIFGEDIISSRTWRFIIRRSETWDSLTFDLDLIHPDTNLGVQYLMTIFPKLTRFTMRVTGTPHWVDHKDIRTLVAESPKLIHLTIFHLLGESPTTGAEPSATCSLQSLHIRQLRGCNQDTLGFLVSNSHKSLQELTIVLDGVAWWGVQSHRFYRGIGANDLQASFAPCLELCTLRFADRVAKPGDHDLLLAGNLNAELDPENAPLGYILDDMIKKLRKLEVLRICGRTFSMKIFENLNTSGCVLKELSIQSYPAFPMPSFLEHLKENRALSRLQKLQIGKEIIDDQYVIVLSSACQQSEIELQIIEYENVYDDITHLLL